MTGEEGAVMHSALLEDTSFREPMIERIATGPWLHNHPSMGGVAKDSPGVTDWQSLREAAGQSGILRSWIISKNGITTFSIPPDAVVVGEENVKKAFEEIWDFVDECKEVGLSGDPSTFTETEIRQISDLEAAFAAKFGGTSEMISWENSEKIKEAASAILQLCK